VPEDSDSLIYVWFDALLSYITSAERLNLIDYTKRGSPSPQVTGNGLNMVNVVGKDIIKFHSNMWPLMLTGFGLDSDQLNQNLVCHGHWIKDNRKMSKSLGNVVDPFDILAKYPLEAVKFYVLVNGPLQKDANFEEADLVNLYNGFIDKIINCYTRIFGKNMKKKTSFQFTKEELFSHMKDLHDKQNTILTQI
jgi:methionyl-tRNA synthetase